MNGALEIILLTLMIAYGAYALIANRSGGPETHKRSRAVVTATQTPAFVIACVLGARQGVFSRDLVSPVSIGAGLVAGHIIFGLSLLFIHRSFRFASAYFKDFGALWDFVTASPVVLTRFLVVGIGEEMIYRVGFQAVLIGALSSAGLGISVAAAVAIAVTAALFCVVHDHFFRNEWWVSVEFTIFALALGALYYWSHSLILVIVVHAVRDIEVAYLEFLVRSEELGDKEKALDEMEQTYLRKHPRHAGAGSSHA